VCQRSEEKSPFLKFPVPRSPVRLAAILEKLSTLLIYSPAFSVRTGRNIRTQFLYDNSIYPPAARQRPCEVHWFYRTRLYRFIPDVPSTSLTIRTFYSANGRTLFAHTVGNSRSKRILLAFHEFISRVLPEHAASRRFMKIDRSVASAKFRTRDILLSNFETLICKATFSRSKSIVYQCLNYFKICVIFIFAIHAFALAVILNNIFRIKLFAPAKKCCHFFSIINHYFFRIINHYFSIHYHILKYFFKRQYFFSEIFLEV